MNLITQAISKERSDIVKAAIGDLGNVISKTQSFSINGKPDFMGHAMTDDEWLEIKSIAKRIIDFQLIPHNGHVCD